MKRSISNCYSRCTVRRWDCCKVLGITLVIMCIIDTKQHRTVLNHKWMSKTHWCGRFPFGVSTLLFMLRIHTWCSWVVLKYNHASFQSMLTEPHPFHHQPFDCWILAGGVAGGQLNQLRSCTSNQINGRFSWVSQCGNAGYVSGVLSWMDVAYIRSVQYLTLSAQTWGWISSCQCGPAGLGCDLPRRTRGVKVWLHRWWEFSLQLGALLANTRCYLASGGRDLFLHIWLEMGGLQDLSGKKVIALTSCTYH